MAIVSKHLPHAILTDFGTIWNKNAFTASFVVFGQLVSMKNSRRLLKNRRTGKTFSAKSEEAMKYLEDFCRQVPPEYRGIKLGSMQRPLRIVCSVFYQSRRSDLDIALLLDCLQVAEVIRNDRDIIEQHLYAEVDAKNPRVELLIEEI